MAGSCTRYWTFSRAPAQQRSDRCHSSPLCVLLHACALPLTDTLEAQAYRVQARRHHPDKPGGSSARFSKIQEAFETLSQPRSRAVYDTWARELRFRYLDEYRVRPVELRLHACASVKTCTRCPHLRPATAAAKSGSQRLLLRLQSSTESLEVVLQAPGGEDILLDELAGRGLVCDPLTQLVVTCEVCRRPATKQCWTCGMQICEFCTLKRHWKVGPWVYLLSLCCTWQAEG